MQQSTSGKPIGTQAAKPVLRAVLYLRVSTGRQAEQDLSIPDQKKQTKAWCEARGWEVVAEYVEPGASAMDDKRGGALVQPVLPRRVRA
jgi:hypothetical protein